MIALQTVTKPKDDSSMADIIEFITSSLIAFAYVACLTCSSTLAMSYYLKINGFYPLY